MSKTVYRQDRGGHGALRSPVTTPQGFLRAQGHAARTGIYEYRRADGSIQRELRPREEVMHPDSLASYASAPVTLEHPADEEVNAENVRRHEVGHVEGPARADGDAVTTDTLIKDAKAIKAVKAGKQELSPGYKIRLDETSGFAPEYAYPGNPTGRYDAVQRDIRVNHLAIVDRARGGSAMRLRMDAAEVELRSGDAVSPRSSACSTSPAFAAPEDQGLAIGDVSQIREAMRRFDSYLFATPESRKAAYRRIVRAGIERDVDVSGFATAHRADSMAVMTTADKGHQHLIDPKDWNGCDRSAGDTSYAVSEGETNSHSHPWIRDPYGKITIGESEGHGHGILVDESTYGAPASARP